MELETIVVLVTVVVTFLCGLIAKKVSWFNNHLIPIQNILIGVIVAIIEFIITKDFSVAIALSGLIAGGAYDIGNNLKKITNNQGGLIMEDVKQNKIIEDRISDTEYVEELPEDYKEVAPGTEGTNVLEENNIE